MLDIEDKFGVDWDGGKCGVVCGIKLFTGGGPLGT